MKKIFVAFLISGIVFASACGGGGNNGDDGLAQRLVFYTSITGRGDLSSWADVSGSGLTGLEAADGICQARAEAAGLSGTFVAWLSDDSSDAYCRANGLNGKKDDNCGETELPTGAGPWFRTDGKPFSGSINELVDSSMIYCPVRADEFGSVHDASYLYWTGTRENGTLVGDNCSNWSDSTSPETINLGNTTATVHRFTEGSHMSCINSARLLCLEIGTGNSVPAPDDTGKVVFVTSARGTGNLGSWPQADGETGVLAGDNICQELASTAGLANPLSFRAWLSDSSVDAADRITSDGPWVRLDGVQVAASKSALVNSFLNTSIALTEEGQYEWFGVWTGTLEGGTKSAWACSDWTIGTIDIEGESGDTAYSNDYSWTSIYHKGCGSDYALYCFED